MFNIITHSRFFNLDEVAAIALLDIFLLNGKYNLIRTRDEKILQKHQADINSYVIDVGFKFEKDKLNFDHHQKSMNKTWSDGTPFSSCGLIWEHLKENGHINLPNNVIQKFESVFIKRVDAQDNGVRYFNEMNFVAATNRNHHDNNFIDLQFKRALKQVTHFIEIAIVNIQNKKKDLLCKNTPVNGFLDKLTAVALVRNFAFSNKVSYKIENDVVSFDYLNLKNEQEQMEFDFNKHTFRNNDQVINVKGNMTVFIWNLMKQTKLLSQKMNDETALLVEEKIINHFKSNAPVIDFVYIAMFENSDKPIKDAYDSMFSYVVNAFVEVRTEIQANKSIDKLIKKSKELDGIVFCDQNIKGAPMRIANVCKDKQLVIIPRDRKSWKIQVIPNRKEHYSQTIAMPKQWCGLKGDKLVDVSGVKGLIFCHKAAFMCMFEGSKDEAITLAKKIINF